MGRCLLLVDPQCDFIDGALPVPGAKEAMGNLAAYLNVQPDRYALKIATCDFHPWAHCSFQENGGPWPRHCVAHSRGAAIWPDLLAPLYEASGRTVVMCKGVDSGQEEYSIFHNAKSANQLLTYLKSEDIDAIDICGLAGDICVLNTLRDCLRHVNGIKPAILGSFSPSLDGGKALSDFCAQESVCIR